MTKENIRFAMPQDVPDVLRFCKLHAEHEGFSHNAGSMQNNQDALIELIFGLEPAMRCLVVEVDGQLMGYATFMKQYSTWFAKSYLYLDCLFLVKEARGQGIGKRLMNRVALEAKRMGCDSIEWQTPQSNDEAIEFYRTLGAIDN